MENTRAGDGEAALYVDPAATGNIGTYVVATGTDEAALLARGWEDPPIPDRCCAICSGLEHDGTTHALTHDVTGTNPLTDNCTTFALHFWTDGSINGWYCKFYAGDSAFPVFVDPLDDPEPVHLYSVAFV